MRAFCEISLVVSVDPTHVSAAVCTPIMNTPKPLPPAPPPPPEAADGAAEGAAAAEPAAAEPAAEGETPAAKPDNMDVD